MPVSRVTARRMADAVVTERCGLPLNDWLADRRDTGTGWDSIATELVAATDGIVEVSGKTLSRWWDDQVEETAA